MDEYNWNYTHSLVSFISHEPVVPAHHGPGILSLAGSEETDAAQPEQTLNPTAYQRASISFFTLFIAIY